MTATSGSTRTVIRTCPLCEATCGLELTLDEADRIVAVRGDREDVFSHGFICPKGAALGELEDDPDRLTRPLVRHGSTFEEVDWDTAFAAIAEGLGPILASGDRNAVGLYAGNPNVHNLAGTFYIKPLAKALGSRNVFSATSVDQLPKYVSCGLLFGDPIAIPIPDLDRTDHLLMLGANPRMSNGSLCTAPDFPGRLKALRERGGKVVVVDPRRTRTARDADEHHFIRPGTDPYLLAAMVRVLFEDELVDLGDVADLVDGVDEVRAAVEPFTPDHASERCGIPADTIVRLAHELAAAPTAAVYGRLGTSTVAHGTAASWLVDVLNTLTGNLDRPGGVLFTRPASVRHPAGDGGRPPFQLGRWTSRVRGLPETNGELPVATLADEILTPGEGRIRALLTVAGNPVVSTPNSARLAEALEQLEFMVSVDPYLNETTRHADVILPPPPSLSRSHYDAAFYLLSVRNVANYSPPVTTANGRPEEWELLLRLTAIVAGQGADADVPALDDFLIGAMVETAVGSSRSPIHGRDREDILAVLAPRTGPDRMLDLLLRVGPYGDGFGADPNGLTLTVLEAHPHGLDLGPLEPRIGEVLATASGRIELAPARILEDLADLSANGSAPDGLLLVGRRHLRSNNSWMHNVGSLLGGTNRCTLLVHPDDATRLGLADGADAWVGSRVGRVRVPIELDEDIMPGVVSLPHGWGHDEEGTLLRTAAKQPGTNSNVLSDDEALDGPSGNAVLNGIPVTVRRA